MTFAADKSTALLDVVEANPFKHLTHLSLKVLLAGDSVLKKYLAECLISLRVCMYISDAYVCMYVSILYTLVSTVQYPWSCTFQCTYVCMYVLYVCMYVCMHACTGLHVLYQLDTI